MCLRYILRARNNSQLYYMKTIKIVSKHKLSSHDIKEIASGVSLQISNEAESKIKKSNDLVKKFVDPICDKGIAFDIEE